MIEFKGQLNKKDREKVLQILDNIPDLWGDFYITRANLRLDIKSNTHVLFKNLKNGDKILFGENAIGVVTGFSDNANRKYLKILFEDKKEADKILKVLNWNITHDVFIKIKKRNPLQEVLKRNGFRFLAGRGKEILFLRKYIKYRENKYVKRHSDKN